MEYPPTTSPEFLKTEEGKAFARKLLAELSLPAGTPPNDPQPEPPEKAFATLKHEFIERLDQHVDDHDFSPDEEQALKEALDRIYEERFLALYPAGDPVKAALFILDLTRIVGWLATVTYEVYLIATRQKDCPGWNGPPPRPPFRVLPDHLYWAREALGWWAAGWARLNYRLKIRPRESPFLQALREAADDAPTRPVELENGCPLC